MSRSVWLARSLAVLALSVPVVCTPAGAAVADHRHGGWYSGHYRHHDHRRGGHHHGRRHRHDRGISGLFMFDFSPPPPPRRVIVVPPPVHVQPAPVYVQPPPRAYCREYTSTVLVNGRPVESYGTACLQPDGSWRIVSMN